MEGNEAHENPFSCHSRSKFTSDPNRSNGAAASGLLIWKNFPVKTALLGSFGRRCIDLCPGHPMDGFYLIKEGVELARFQILKFILKWGVLKIALDKFTLGGVRFLLIGQAVFSGVLDRSSSGDSWKTIH